MEDSNHEVGSLRSGANAIGMASATKFCVKGAQRRVEQMTRKGRRFLCCKNKTPQELFSRGCKLVRHGGLEPRSGKSAEQTKSHGHGFCHVVLRKRSVATREADDPQGSEVPLLQK